MVKPERGAGRDYREDTWRRLVERTMPIAMPTVERGRAAISTRFWHWLPCGLAMLPGSEEIVLVCDMSGNVILRVNITTGSIDVLADPTLMALLQG